MTQVPSPDSQLDRVEGKLDQVLDRLTRMEERQNGQAAKLDSHEARLVDQEARLRDVELKQAVAATTNQQNNERLTGRWGAIGSVALVIVGGFVTFVGNWLISHWPGGR